MRSLLLKSLLLLMLLFAFLFVEASSRKTFFKTNLASLHSTATCASPALAVKKSKGFLALNIISENHLPNRLGTKATLTVQKKNSTLILQNKKGSPHNGPFNFFIIQ